MKFLQNLIRLYLLVLLVFLLPFESKAGYELSFQFDNVRNAKATLGCFYGSEIQIIDSAKFDAKGSLVFRGDKQLPQGLYLLQFNGRSFDFILDKNVLSIKAIFPRLELTSQALGSEENTIYFEYRKRIIKRKRTLDSLKHLVGSNQQTKEARYEMKKTKEEFKQYEINLFRKNSSSLACKIIKAGDENFIRKKSNESGIDNLKLIRDDLFSNIDLGEERLIRTPYVEERIVDYLKYTTFDPDSLMKSCDEIVLKMQQSPNLYRFCVNCLLRNFEKNNKPWMDVLYTRVAHKYYFSEKMIVPDSNEYYTVKSNVRRIDPLLTGKPAPRIDFLDVKSDTVSLYSIKSKFTILYFWDADCSHCQVETPKMFDLYKKIKEKGVEVYAVTVQQTWQSWLEYIKKNGLNWINVWDPLNIQELYKTYQIGSTPTIFLLDRDKKIIYKRMSVEELDVFLKKVLK